MSRTRSLGFVVLQDAALLVVLFGVLAAIGFGVGTALGMRFEPLPDATAAGPPRGPLPSWFLVVAIALQLAFVLYPAVRERRKLLGWLTVSGRDLGLGVGGAVAMLLCAVAYEPVLRLTGYEVPDLARLLLSSMPRWLVFTLAVVAAPLGEELYFRGRLFDAVAERRGLEWAVAITAPAFALIHGMLMLLPVYIAFGLILAWLRVRTGGLAAPILAHLLNNLATLLISTALP